MLKGNEIIGKPVIALDSGKKLHKVQDVIFDQSTSTVLGFLVDEGGWFSSAKVLPLTSIKTIGEDAIIVENEASIVSAQDNPQIKSILEAENVLKGTKVMTEDGKDLGTMKDLHFDQSTGVVHGYEVSGGIFADAYAGRPVVPAPSTITIGQDVAFVPAETAHLMQQQAGGIKAAMQSASNKLQDVKESAAQKGQELSQQATETSQDLKAKATSPEMKDKIQTTTEQLKQQAKEFWEYVREKASVLKDQGDQKMEEMKINNALGRPVNRVIFDKQDQVILNVGDIITHQAIERAREAGVLPILLNSVYTKGPELSKDEMRV